MTGHDLDLDEAIAAMHTFIAEQVGFDAGEPMDRQAEEAVTRIAPLIARDLRAKLAAAEQERDTAKVNAVAALRLLEADRDKLAAVREVADEYRGDRVLNAAAVVREIDAALAAAEQDEPKRNEIPEPDGQSRDWSDALEVMLEESRPQRRGSTECSSLTSTTGHLPAS